MPTIKEKFEKISVDEVKGSAAALGAGGVGIALAAIFGGPIVAIPLALAGGTMLLVDSLFTNKKAVMQQQLLFGIIKVYENYLDKFMNN